MAAALTMPMLSPSGCRQVEIVPEVEPSPLDGVQGRRLGDLPGRADGIGQQGHVVQQREVQGHRDEVALAAIGDEGLVRFGAVRLHRRHAAGDGARRRADMLQQPRIERVLVRPGDFPHGFDDAPEGR
jgi:hypothetical protein